MIKTNISSLVFGKISVSLTEHLQRIANIFQHICKVIMTWKLIFHVTWKLLPLIKVLLEKDLSVV